MRLTHRQCTDVGEEMAGVTGLEPATSGVTGQHSNQLNYRSALFPVLPGKGWRPQGDSNPCRNRERVVS